MNVSTSYFDYDSISELNKLDSIAAFETMSFLCEMMFILNIDRYSISKNTKISQIDEKNGRFNVMKYK